MERIRILLVDDDRQNSELLKKFLEVEGYEVDYAEHGRAGWKMYAANRPDLVLLDINMPEMNGFELARKIRGQDCDVLIFFLTDRTEKADERFEHRQASLPSRMVIGQTIFDCNLSTIEYAGTVQHLSARQLEILAILAQHIGQTVERSYLLEHVWGNDSYANSLALNVQITYIRKLLEPDTTLSIVSLKKRGYRLEVM